MSAPLLAIEHLSVDYRSEKGTAHALRCVSLTAQAGEVVGIVGESGSGKSTLAAAVANLLPPAARIVSGRILFDGEDVLALGAARQRRLRGDDIAMVFQDPMRCFNPVLTIGDQLVDYQHQLGLSRTERRGRAAAMLGRVGIADPGLRLESYPHELSGGMRQRVAIAAALLVRPKLLIADEPTTALDVTMEAQIVHLFRELRSEFGGALVIVTHHLGVVAELCDRVYVMYAGEVAEHGAVDEIFHDPRHPYTRALLGCDPAVMAERAEELPVIAGQPPDLAHLPRGCVFAARCACKTDLCETEGAISVDITAGHMAHCREALTFFSSPRRGEEGAHRPLAMGR